MAAGFAAIFYYQSSQSVQLNLDILTEKQQLTEQDNTSLRDQLVQLEGKNTELMSELNSAREALSAQQDDSVSKLTITSQMLENMEQQLVILKSEKAELQDQLNLAKQALTELESQKQTETSKLTSAHNNKLSELNKELDSRKAAYQALANRQQEMRDEMDRLSNLVANNEKELVRLRNDKSALNTQLTSAKKALQLREAEFNSLQNNYQDLDAKLKALVSPVGSSSSKSATTSSNSDSSQTKQAEAVNNPGNITGLEEIKKPKPAPAKTQQNTTDYDQIKVLP
jgi:chromosome segregation ATPase